MNSISLGPRGEVCRPRAMLGMDIQPGSGGTMQAKPSYSVQEHKRLEAQLHGPHTGQNASGWMASVRGGRLAFAPSLPWIRSGATVHLTLDGLDQLRRAICPVPTKLFRVSLSWTDSRSDLTGTSPAGRPAERSDRCPRRVIRGLESGRSTAGPGLVCDKDSRVLRSVVRVPHLVLEEWTTRPERPDASLKVACCMNQPARLHQSSENNGGSLGNVRP